MKRLRSYGDDLGSVGEKETTSSSSQHHRRFYSKGMENGRSRPSPVMDDDRDRDREGSVSRGGGGFRKRSEFDDREGFRGVRRRIGDESEGFDRRKPGFDRYGGRDRERDGSLSNVSPRGGTFDKPSSPTYPPPRGGGYGVDRERDRERERDRDRDRERDGMGGGLSPRGGGYVGERERERDRERIHRSESFCVSRRDYPKGFRSERHWSRREDGVSSSWRRFDSRGKKDVDEDTRSSPVEKGSGGGGSSSSKGGGMDSGGVSSSKESLRSPRGIKDVRSPTWSKDSTRDSKDSGTEHSKETKKNESMVVDSGGGGNGNGNGNGVGNGSDMEEGELQPELNQAQAQAVENRFVPEKNVKNVDKLDEKFEQEKDTVKKACELNVSEIGESGLADSIDMDRKFAREDEKVSDEVVIGGGKQVAVVEVSKNVNVRGANPSLTGQNESDDKVFVSEETKSFVLKGSETASAVNNDGRLMENQSESSAPIINSERMVKVEEHELKGVDKSSPERDEQKIGFDFEVGLRESNKVIVDDVPKDLEPCVPVLKDKGKGVAVCSPGETNLTETNLLVERNFIACQNDAMEGPSVRGFELFSSSAGLKTDCTNRSSGSKADEKLKLEPLDLSLSLPNVSVPAASNSVAAASNSVAAVAAAAPPPSSPPRARSVQSFGTTLRTGSDCFTTSISFSGSQFVHNPSCSLTHNSVDYDFEQSVKSRPLFQGVDWQALSGTDTLPKEILANTKLVSSSNGNGSLHLSQSSQGILNGRAVQQASVAGVDLLGKMRYQEDFRSPALSAGSHDTRSEYGKDRKRVTGEDSVSRLNRSSSQREMEQGVAVERELVERLIFLVASEQIQTMAWRINEMPERSVAFLKDTVCEMIMKEENHRKLRALQDVLRKRSDLNLETLLKSHRVQLQIIVALKTSLPDFVQRADSISSSDLAEIYLGMKCRNINCRSALPVDECDCKFCSQKDGYCSSCMCLVCSKFDTASNTCGWAGCDVCNHWCHTDCGLLKSYIRNGRSAAGSQGISEMQFYCLACDHPSEMFGFVKDVFKTCAPEWKSETFLRELEYVRKIFSGSNDYRGKVLHDAAKQLITRLQNGANPVEICKQIMGFINEGDNKSGNAIGSSGRDQLQPQPIENHRGTIQAIVTHTQEPMWSKPNSSKELPRMENIGVTLPNNEGSAYGGSLWSTDIPMGKGKDSGDGLDSIVKIKLAEAQLFQKRADAARKEAEDLQRIASAKTEKVEEEYASRIAKLRLSEVEERRRQKHEELQTLERSHREYFNMKTRMETDIKDLLLKMEATKRNLST